MDCGDCGASCLTNDRTYPCEVIPDLTLVRFIAISLNISHRFDRMSKLNFVNFMNALELTRNAKANSL